MANVYVFNMLGETIQKFAPNGLTAGQIARWSGPDTAAPFTPAQLVVPLVDASGDESLKHGRFAYGKNHVLFQTGASYTFNVNIPSPGKNKDGEENPPEDLLLYVNQGTWDLYRAEGKRKGKLIKQGKIKEQAPAESDDEEEEEAA